MVPMVLWGLMVWTFKGGAPGVAGLSLLPTLEESKVLGYNGSARYHQVKSTPKSSPARSSQESHCWKMMTRSRDTQRHCTACETLSLGYPGEPYLRQPGDSHEEMRGQDQRQLSPATRGPEEPQFILCSPMARFVLLPELLCSHLLVMLAEGLSGTFSR